MKIAYIDLGLSKEDFALNAKIYGGAATVPRHLKQLNYIDFYIFAPEWCYTNFGPEDRKDKCFILPENCRKAIEYGYPLDQIISGLENFDIILFFHGNLFINRGNLKVPLVHISAFDNSCCHPNNDYTLFYLPCFKPIEKQKAKYVKLGKTIPKEFIETKRENFVFQCSRMDETMRPISLIKECQKYNIPLYLAGPIMNNYPLLEYIDGKLIKYLGQISEQEKNYYYSRARAFALLHNWDKLPFNQSIIEANALGCPVITTKLGYFLPDYIKEGVNGFFYNNNNFKECYDKSLDIKQIDCYNSSKEYSVEEMTRTFCQAFFEIKNEWKYEKV